MQKYGIYSKKSDSMYPVVKDSKESLDYYLSTLGIKEDEEEHLQPVIIVDLETFNENKKMIQEMIDKLQKGSFEETK